ncbi:MAG: response regulator transcription factor [Dokdonella sp.]|uniref:response regulator transcription factor n=1 Tax=Dokdonella sp. TaxID=2291710 RepID=UPI0025BFF886|nr:response regulator transcription factor [Dokdonella sp.]MBZ0222858.1 response regulator transcription factor [Dokdonella sp.]MCC7256220.1 response regulator transcription factor [Dokdonella sp.]
MKLLLVEDSDRLRTTLARGLGGSGFAVDTAADGSQARIFLDTYAYDLVVLDIMLPGIDGLGILRGLMKRQLRPRVLVLSARDGVRDRIEALNLGADDYLVKPFDFDELLARLHALARRPEQAQTRHLDLGALSIDLRARQTCVGTLPLSLTPREFALLELLVRNRGRVFSRIEILERTAGSDIEVSDRSVEVLVFGLRRKLAQAGLDRLIETRRGSGYLIA